MLVISAILFGVAALGGIILAFQHKKQQRPIWVSITHGIVAASGLVTLIIGVLQGMSNGLVLTSLVLFIVVALGGFVLFAYRMRESTLPSPLVYVHGIVAVVAFLLLLVGIGG